MAPLPENNTACLFLDYSDGVHPHTILWRYAAPGTLSTAKAALDAFLTAMTAGLYLITVLGARVRAAASTVSNPTVWLGASTYGSGAMPVVNAPREVRFLGRATDGRKVSVSVYGMNVSTPGDYRFQAGDDANVDAGVISLNDAITDSSWVTISGVAPIVYPYADINFNSYWERKARG